MNQENEYHYHCLIDPSDHSIISQEEVLMDGRSPLSCGDSVICAWGRPLLPSMKDRETRSLIYYYATSQIRPHRAVAEFTKGPFVLIRSVMGSSHPGSEEVYDCQYGYGECQPASYDEFPLPENPPDYLAKENFYDLEAIEKTLAGCIDALKVAIAQDYEPDTIARLLESAETMVASIGGKGLLPHPVPFFGENEEKNALLFLDLVIFVLLNKSDLYSISEDAMSAYQQRRSCYEMTDNQILHLLASFKPKAD